MPCEARVTNGLGAMNYRIMARSAMIIQRRRRKQADGKAHTKNGKDGGSDYGLQAWDETFVRNKASSLLQREQVAGCIRAPTAAIIIGQRETIAEPTTTMRTRKRMLRPRKGRHRRRCTKSIKKHIPPRAGLSVNSGRNVNGSLARWTSSW